MFDQKSIGNIRKMNHDLLQLIEAYELLEDILLYISPYAHEINGQKIDEKLRRRIENFENFDDSE
jgi:hypothetical protein